ncbi:autotransporter domain-containing protein, partial [Candidatus Synechococcus spongiarum]|uniref:autotransporter domain-containing protein n=1 Tax=Candidatus Synechococcus spongiarum TaxID=431041 RepID=UPI0005598E61
GALSSFHGQEDTLSLNGNVTTALVGADWRTEQWQAGAALSHSWGDGGYEGEGDNDGGGKISATMTGLFPYGRYALTPRLGVWAVAGYGWGQLSLTPDGAEREYQPGATMVMGAVGIDGLLIDGGADGFSLSTTTDLLTLKTTTEQTDNRSSSEGSVSRLRMGLEATRPVPLPNDASLLPSLEVGIRHDGGDAESGFGLEVGATLAWNDPQRGISAELKGRSLLTHMDEHFQEQGLALSFSWNPDPSNRGPSLSMGHTMGDAASGMDALLDPTVLEGVGASAGNGQQFKAQLAYGFPTHNDRLTMTPALAVALSPTTSTYSLLWSLAPYSPHQPQTEPWEIALEAERQETNSPTSPVVHSLDLSFSLLF